MTRPRHRVHPAGAAAAAVVARNRPRPFKCCRRQCGRAPGGRAIVFASRQGCNHFCEVRGGCVWGSVLAITWTRAVISCRVNCCGRPVFKKNLVLTSQLTAVVCGRRRPRHLRILFFTTSTSATCRRRFADVPAGSDVADFRCPMCTSAEL